MRVSLRRERGDGDAGDFSQALMAGQLCAKLYISRQTPHGLSFYRPAHSRTGDVARLQRLACGEATSGAPKNGLVALVSRALRPYVSRHRLFFAPSYRSKM